ncbi:uncharacterized protein LOC117384977 [Periophthalmus magnuspinnatus]|uniref:uncharacterized protein LOC117384977 n=1 Tax=Periophthalmus magnuspinnatus TaxID=409849 RepID=UPI0024372DF9|nr:uncharacterized protein LOC117384977 [Periophthalmus magnuspinnatus]
MAMAVFRPVLVFLSLLHCTESVSAPHEFVKEGGKITLSCNNVRERQRKCSGTTWIFNSAKRTESTEELITHGQVGSRVTEMSNRLKVTENCGLEIQNVQSQDAGLFHCQQYDTSVQPQRLVPDAPVYLSVVSVTKTNNKENVQLRCNVSSILSDVETKWLLNGQDVNDLTLTTTDRRDATTVTVPKSYFYYKDVNLFKCEVSHGVNKKIFSLRSNKPEEAQTTASPQNKSTYGGWLWAVVVVVAAVLLTVVALVTWRRLRVKSEDTGNDPPVEPEEGVSYATVSYKRNNQRNEVRPSEEAMIYSSVRNTTVEDPAQLYATVKK